MDHTSQHQIPCSKIHVFSPDPSPSNLPVGNVSFSHPIQSLSVGFNFALLTDGHNLFSWGYHGEFHRLGLDLPESHRIYSPTPVNIPGNPTIVQCAAGGNHSLVLDVDGNVFSFGSDDTWQLGRSDSSPLPNLVPLGQRVVEVRAGWNFSLAVSESRDTIITWGSGSDGQLAHGYFPQYSQPQQVRMPGQVEIITVGYSHVAAVLRGRPRRVVTWGNDGVSFTQQHLIRDVPRLPAEDIVDVAAGKSYTLFLSHNGTVYSVGLSHQGQLGLGDRYGRNHACIISALLRYNIIQVAAANVFSSAFSDEGKLFVWGAGEIVPVRVPTSGFGLVTRNPFSLLLRIEASAGIAMATGIAPDQVDSCFSIVRPLRGFVLAVCNGEVLDGIRRTKVFYRCIVSGHPSPCSECVFMAYGPLLAAASPGLRILLNHSNERSLDMSAYTRDSVVATVILLCSGFLDPNMSVATAQEVSGILYRFRAPWSDRIVTEYLRRRLLPICGEDVCDLWDTTDSNTERSDEIRMRNLLSRVSSTNCVRIIVDYEDGVRVLDFAIDALVACAHSEKIRSRVCHELRVAHGQIISEWREVLFGPIVSEAAIDALRGWLDGRSFHIPENANRQANVSFCADVMRVAGCLGISLLKSISERCLISLLDTSLMFSTWKFLVEITLSLGYFRARDKLLAIGDAVCTSVHFKLEERRVQKMERAAIKSRISQDVEKAKSGRRSLQTFRRSKVYCDSFMDTNQASDNVKVGCIKDDRFHGEGDGRLDGRQT